MSKKIGINSFVLHVIAMLFMLLDHLAGTLFPQYDWLHSIGRLAFPIFAFLIVEGYFHTSNIKQYLIRLFVFALISEIPYNLMTHRNFIYPFGQNVLWTFLIALIAIILLEKIKNKNIILRLILGILIIIISQILGLLLFVDYHSAGVTMVLMFYLLKIKDSYSTLLKIVIMALQAIGMYYICDEMIAGLVLEYNICGFAISIHRQSFAVLSLIFIWLYDGKLGLHNKFIKYFNYLFYPIHMLILGLILQIFY